MHLLSWSVVVLSLVEIIKSKGSKIEPCGVPVWSKILSDIVLFTHIISLVDGGKQLLEFLLIPEYCSTFESILKLKASDQFSSGAKSMYICISLLPIVL